VTGAKLRSIDNDLLLRIHRIVVLTRTIDERLWTLARQGRAGFVLTARGHEVAQVASTAALRQGVDSAWPYYRDLGVALALGVTPFELFLGALGRADDPHSGGRQLTSHFSSKRLRLGSISSEVGAHLPHAVGAAWAARVRGEDSVAMCWFGDGASSEGGAHEAMNMAAVASLPVVFVCENNGYAISVPLSQQMAVPSVAERASGYGMAGATVDGTDAAAVFSAASAAVERARRGDGPSLIDLQVPRLVPHSSQDDELYRSDDERAAAAASDPLPRLEQEVVAAGLLQEAEVATLRRAMHDAVRDDVERALASPTPGPERARQWLFAGDPPHAMAAALSAEESLPPGVFRW
jgi:2-oxoisovalerate dehydrogenase E1 component alpha subunit